VDWGSGAEEGAAGATGANGRSLLVRVPFAERFRAVDVAAAAATGEAGVERPAVAAGGVLVGALAGGAFLDPAAVAPPLVAPPWDAPPLVEPDREDPLRGVAALFGVAALVGADVEGFLVGFSALMEQRYAVFTARRESDPGPPTPATSSRRVLPPADSAARR
jgi:hypothetical protein